MKKESDVELIDRAISQMIESEDGYVQTVINEAPCAEIAGFIYWNFFEFKKDSGYTTGDIWVLVTDWLSTHEG